MVETEGQRFANPTVRGARVSEEFLGAHFWAVDFE
jgi:hypothetical protein